MFQAQHRKPRGFTRKPAQRSAKENKITLVARHEQKLSQYAQARSKTLPLKRRQLEATEKRVTALRAAKREAGRLTATQRNELFELKQQRNALRETIAALERREDENRYHLRTADVVAKYITTGDTFQGEAVPRGPQRTASAAAPQRRLGAPGRKPARSSASAPGDTLATWMRTKRRPSSVDRRELLETWCATTDPKFVPRKPRCVERPNQCPDPECGAVDELAVTPSGQTNCAACGTRIDVAFAARNTMYKETKSTEVVAEFPYQRINHFNEWLSQIQGKQNTEIREKVYVGLEAEFKKYKITDYRTLTPKFVKSCLQKLGYEKYYEHVEFIIAHFKGAPPPVLTVELEEEFRQMFREIQAPFEKHKPPGRKNFLSYSYIMHNMAVLTGQDHLLKHFPLLKSRQKLKVQDDIWRKMCADLRWEAIPTV